MVGLDLMRAAGACWLGLPAQKVITSVAGDRLASLVGMLLVVAASIPLLAMRAELDVVLLGVLPLFALGGGVAAALLVDRIPFARALLIRWSSVPLDMLTAIRRALLSRAGGTAVLLAALVQVLSVAALILIARGLSVDIAFADGFIVLPLALLSASLPISINGWGVREGALVFGFGLLGIDDPRVFAVSIVFGLWMILSSLPGGFLWLALRRVPRELGDDTAAVIGQRT
jgi:hypothetical protein